MLRQRFGFVLLQQFLHVVTILVATQNFSRDIISRCCSCFLSRPNCSCRDRTFLHSSHSGVVTCFVMLRHHFFVFIKLLCCDLETSFATYFLLAQLISESRHQNPCRDISLSHHHLSMSQHGFLLSQPRHVNR